MRDGREFCFLYFFYECEGNRSVAELRGEQNKIFFEKITISVLLKTETDRNRYFLFLSFFSSSCFFFFTTADEKEEHE